MNEPIKNAEPDRSLSVLIDEPEGTNKWQPIETAPKDGTPVLLAIPWHGEGRGYLRFIGRWDWNCNRWEKGESNRTYFTERMQAAFTHWMPLPKPPEGNSDE